MMIARMAGFGQLNGTANDKKTAKHPTLRVSRTRDVHFKSE